MNEALSITRACVGGGSSDTAKISLNNLEQVCIERKGDILEAEPLYGRARPDARVWDGSSEYGVSLNNLAGLYLDQGRLVEAASLSKEAVEIMVRVLGVEHPKTKIVRENYERLLAKMKE